MRKLFLIIGALSSVTTNNGCKPAVSGRPFHELASDQDTVLIDRSTDEVFPPIGPGNALYDEIQRLKAARKAALEKQQTSDQ
jgi:hypothetical protein